jgi:hypothetical protein
MKRFRSPTGVTVRVEGLAGQAHEAMTAAPELYAESVTRFLLS